MFYFTNCLRFHNKQPQKYKILADEYLIARNYNYKLYYNHADLKKKTFFYRIYSEKIITFEIFFSLILFCLKFVVEKT